MNNNSNGNYNQIDFWRQLDIFPPDSFNIPIHIIGTGATGSYITFLLAKMGCTNITVYDPDLVENHNLPNQIFGLQNIGASKVESLADIIKRDCGVELRIHKKKVSKPKVGGIVFVLTDSMSSRKEIWLNSIKKNPDIDLMIETRMGADFGRIFCVDPIKHCNYYEKTLHSDKNAQESPCTRRAIAPTVSTIAGMAVYALINHVNKLEMVNDTIVTLSPPMIIANKWGENKQVNKKQ